MNSSEFTKLAQAGDVVNETILAMVPGNESYSVGIVTQNPDRGDGENCGFGHAVRHLPASGESYWEIRLVATHLPRHTAMAKLGQATVDSATLAQAKYEALRDPAALAWVERSIREL